MNIYIKLNNIKKETLLEVAKIKLLKKLIDYYDKGLTKNKKLIETYHKYLKKKNINTIAKYSYNLTGKKKLDIEKTLKNLFNFIDYFFKNNSNNNIFIDIIGQKINKINWQSKKEEEIEKINKNLSEKAKEELKKTELKIINGILVFKL